MSNDILLCFYDRSLINYLPSLITWASAFRLRAFHVPVIRWRCVKRPEIEWLSVDESETRNKGVDRGWEERYSVDCLQSIRFFTVQLDSQLFDNDICWTGWVKKKVCGCYLWWGFLDEFRIEVAVVFVIVRSCFRFNLLVHVLLLLPENIEKSIYFCGRLL